MLQALVDSGKNVAEGSLVLDRLFSFSILTVIRCTIRFTGQSIFELLMGARKFELPMLLALAEKKTR